MIKFYLDESLTHIHMYANNLHSFYNIIKKHRENTHACRISKSQLQVHTWLPFILYIHKKLYQFILTSNNISLVNKNYYRQFFMLTDNRKLEDIIRSNVQRIGCTKHYYHCNVDQFSLVF